MIKTTYKTKCDGETIGVRADWEQGSAIVESWHDGEWYPTQNNVAFFLYNWRNALENELCLFFAYDPESSQTEIHEALATAEEEEKCAIE